MKNQLQLVRAMIEKDPFNFARLCEVIGLKIEVGPETTDEDLALQYIRQRRAAV